MISGAYSGESSLSGMQVVVNGDDTITVSNSSLNKFPNGTYPIDQLSNFSYGGFAGGAYHNTGDFYITVNGVAQEFDYDCMATGSHTLELMIVAPPSIASDNDQVFKADNMQAITNCDPTSE